MSRNQKQTKFYHNCFTNVSYLQIITILLKSIKTPGHLSAPGIVTQYAISKKKNFIQIDRVTVDRIFLERYVVQNFQVFTEEKN